MKRIFFIIWFSLLTLSLLAQDMEKIFESMPDQFIPQLESAWRKDLVDLHKNGKEAKLKNTMNGFSELKQLTNDYLLLQATDRSTIEMKLLPLLNNTHVICMVTTLYGPIPDSRIDFFTTDWHLLDASELFTPVSKDWFIKEEIDLNSPAVIEALSRLDMNLQKYSLHPDQLILTIEFTTPQCLSKEDVRLVSPYLKQENKILTWEKHCFK